MSDKVKLTTNGGCPVVENPNVMTAGPRGPHLLQDVWFLEKPAHVEREVIEEPRMHAKGSGASGTFTVTHDITQTTRAKWFSQIGRKTEVFARFSTVAGECCAVDHWNYREDDTDYYAQPGALLRHIGNCLKADPAYGKGIADALWIALRDVPA